MNRLLILAVGLTFFFCTESKKQNDFELGDKVEESNPTITKVYKNDKLKRLKVWTDSTRILELPFKVNFDTTTQGTFRVKFWETDSIFRNDFKRVWGDVYLMGLLADTTNFYGFAFIAIAAVGNPGLITFDKSGNKVDLKRLTKENCVIYAGDVLLCKEYTTIGKDWSLEYYFKSIIAGEGDSIDTVCSQIVSKGLVNRKGEIDLGKSTKIECTN